MISKTQIKKRSESKRNIYLVKTIELARKNNLLELGKKLSGPTRRQKDINVGELNELNEKKIMLIGRVLGEGNISKKIMISALGFSEQAKEKLAKAGCEMKTIKQEIEDNPKLEGVKIL